MVQPRFWKPDVKVRERRANWYIRGGVPSKKAVEPQIALFNAGKGVGHWFEDDTIYGMWEELLINDWPFSGWDGGDLGHTFLISACTQEKPCK